MYDLIIVGAGIAGLYCAYLNKHQYKILILERNGYIGGRTALDDFEGVKIATGAYGFRPNKDYRAYNLAQKFNLLKPITGTTHNYALFNKITIPEFEKYLTKEDSILNTSTFLQSKFGAKFYRDFLYSNGRSDFELEGIYDTLIHYDLDDNLDPQGLMNIDWNKLAENLAQGLEIKLNTNVKFLQQNKNYFTIYTDDTIYRSKKVVIATDINTLKHLLPNYPLYQEIGANSFIRIYASFNDKGTNILKKYITNFTIVKTILQNVCYVGKNVFMVAYADNNNAEGLKDKADDKHYLEHLLQVSLACPDLTDTIDKVSFYYWSVGTHYYLPFNYEEDYLTERMEFIKKAQNPNKNLYVVGELLSLNQGWVEGALESVDNINL